MPLITDKDIPYGQLNPISTQFNPGKTDLDLNHYSFLQSLKSVVRNSYTYDVLSSITEYKAIVLKRLGEEDLGKPTLFIGLDEIIGLKSNLIRVIAKIPEIHSHLPNPRAENDSEILSMYPIFEGAMNGSAPNPGDLIRVTFQNISNQTGPIYLGPVSGEGSIIGNTFTENTSAKEKFSAGRLASLGARSLGGVVQNGPIQDVGFTSYSRGGSAVNQIVLHESVTSNRGGTIKTLLAKTEKAPHGLSVHFIIDKDGSVSQHLPLAEAGVHADGGGTNHNVKSIGVEIVNLYYGKYATGNDKLLIAVPWADGGTYLAPTSAQLESCWNLMVSLCSNRRDIPAAQYALTLSFPACQISGNSATFYWGRWGGSENATGIMAHCRWGHSDALYVEHYCLARYMGFSPQDAYTVTYNKAFETAKFQKRITTIVKGTLT